MEKMTLSGYCLFVGSFFIFEALYTIFSETFLWFPFQWILTTFILSFLWNTCSRKENIYFEGFFWPPLLLIFRSFRDILFSEIYFFYFRGYYSFKRSIFKNITIIFRMDLFISYIFSYEPLLLYIRKQLLFMDLLLFPRVFSGTFS